MYGTRLTKAEKWILAGIPVLFAVGTFMHFLYQISGETYVTGLVAPVNESVWEHMKMVLWPMILWWSVYGVFLGKPDTLDKDKWFGAGLAAVLVSLISIPLLYYFYTSAFGVELLWVDIFILFLAITLGQLMGLHLYRYSQGMQWQVVLMIFGAVILLFLLFTVYPPHFPLFQDKTTGKYGI